MLCRLRLIITGKCSTSDLPLCPLLNITQALSLTLQFQNTCCLRSTAAKYRCTMQKPVYDYPTIRLPHSFSNLAGLSTRIYQTVHDGTLAFFIVVSRGIATSKNELLDNAAKSLKSPVLTWRRSPVQIRPSPSGFLGALTK